MYPNKIVQKILNITSKMTHRSFCMQW